MSSTLTCAEYIIPSTPESWTRSYSNNNQYTVYVLVRSTGHTLQGAYGFELHDELLGVLLPQRVLRDTACGLTQHSSSSFDWHSNQ